MLATTQELEKLGREPHPVSVRDTSDEFVAAVPWGRWRSVLVYRRRHAGRTWVRLRTFNKHRTKGVWYPSPRFFVVPLASAYDLARAIDDAESGNGRYRKPDWVKEFGRQYAARAKPTEPARST